MHRSLAACIIGAGLGATTTTPAMAQDSQPAADEESQFRQRIWLPDWSPDGSRIAFSAGLDGNWEIYTIKPDGNDLRRHTFDEDADLRPRWSPDGTRLAFYSERQGHEFIPHSFDLFILEVATNRITQVTESDDDEMMPDWAPDGERLYFITNRNSINELRVMHASGDILSAPVAGGSASHVWDPEVLPDGRVALSVYTAPFDGFNKNWDIVIVDPRSDPVTFDTLTDSTRGAFSPSAPARGTRIAYIGFVPGQGSDIYLADLKDRTTTNVTNDDLTRVDLALGPDAKRIAYVDRSRSSEGEADELRVLTLATGEDVRIFRATWGPEGE